MLVSPDIFDYFSSTLPLLRADKSLTAISAWNDNGTPALASDPHIFFRTDFFPDLGWMMTRDFWLSWRVDWPINYWDDLWRQKQERLKLYSSLLLLISMVGNASDLKLAEPRILANMGPVDAVRLIDISLMSSEI